MLWEIVAFVSAFLMIASGIYLYTHQHELIFYPTQVTFPSEEEIQSEYHLIHTFKEIPITTTDNTKIYAYAALHENPSQHRTILYFQSNAGSVLDRMDMILQFYQKLQINMIICVYRGFDKSTGIPTEVAITTDLKRYYDVLQPLGIDMNKVIIMGRSIGASAALKLANEVNSEALIIENGFTTIRDMAKIFIPVIAPFQFLIKDIWDNLSAIKTLDKENPLLLLSSGSDEVVHPSMMKHLYDTAVQSSLPVRMEKFSKAHHMDMYLHNNYFLKLQTFFDDIDNKTKIEGNIENQEVEDQDTLKNKEE
ncbi:Protein bem46 [Entamoeba marina]